MAGNPLGFKATHAKLPQDKDAQLKLAGEHLQKCLREFFEQWGFPLKHKGILASSRMLKAPLATYREFVAYAENAGYVEFCKDIQGKERMFPGGLELTKSQRVECMFRADEVEQRRERMRRKYRD